MIGRRLKQLTVTAKLGRGGMGTVYLAQDSATGQSAAVKVLAESLSGDPAILKRFELEQQIVGELLHPNIVRGHGGVECDGGVHYFVMDYVPGANLARVLRALGRLTAAETVALALQVCDALAFAHARGIVHRDLKPSNLLIDPDGNARVTDFGLAKVAEFTRVTLTGQVLGTPEYMSPEQCEGKPTDLRSDLYSAGVMLFEMLAGRPPFVAENPLALLRKHCEERPPRPGAFAADLPAHLERVVLRCLEKDPFRRYESAADLAADLRATPGAASATGAEARARIAAIVRSSSADQTRPYLGADAPSTAGTGDRIAGPTRPAPAGARAEGPSRTVWAAAATGFLGAAAGLVWLSATAMREGLPDANRPANAAPAGPDGAGATAAAEPRRAELVLVDGTRLLGAVMTLDATHLRFKGEDGRETSHALDQVETVRYQEPRRR